MRLIELGDYIKEEVASDIYPDYWVYENGLAGDSLTFLFIRLEGSPDWSPLIELNQLSGTGWNPLDWSSISVDGNTTTYQINLSQDGSVKFGVITSNNTMGGFYSLKFWEGADPSIYNEISEFIYSAYVDNEGGKGVTVKNSHPEINNFSFNLGVGLWINSSGKITLSGISANFNRGCGIEARNTLSSGSSITCTNCMSNNNRGLGLTIESRGIVNLYNISSSQNTEYGAYIYNDTALSGSPSLTITNISGNIGLPKNGFKGNIGGGLNILSRGKVTLTNVEVSDNHNNGATIENYAAGAYDVKINNCYFDNNNWLDNTTGHGLHITTFGNIVLDKGSASGNFIEGALLDNFNYQTTLSKNITISNFIFNDNGYYGLHALSNGAIKITNIGASGNNGVGAYFRNDTSSSAPAVSINNVSSQMGLIDYGFYENVSGGLNIQSRGLITLTNVRAISNQGDGATITNSKGTADVRITNSYFEGNVENLTSGRGLQINTLGNIWLNKGSASGNAWEGAYLNNYLGQTALVKTVSIVNFIFDENNRFGINVNTNGAIILTSISALNNGGFGISLLTRGAVVLNQINALGNRENGISITNLQSPTYAGVTINNVEVSNNGITHDGMLINTKGSVLINKVIANNNAVAGVIVLADEAISNTHTVVVNGSSFNNNGHSGLGVFSTGAIVVNGITGFGNVNEGIVLDNHLADSITPPSITMLSSLGQNNLSGNGGGIKVISEGNVILNNLIADGNSILPGLLINNAIWDGSAYTGHGDVILSNIIIRNNNLAGLEIYSNGASVKMTGMIVMLNGSDNVPDPEGYSGIVIRSYNAGTLIAVINSASMGNAKHGIYIAKAVTAPMPVLTGTVYFGNNVLGGDPNSNLLIANLY